MGIDPGVASKGTWDTPGRAARAVCDDGLHCSKGVPLRLLALLPSLQALDGLLLLQTQGATSSQLAAASSKDLDSRHRHYCASY